MSNCQCNISSGLLSPGVFNLKQYLNDTQQMVWTLSTTLTGSGCDLCDYDAFLALNVGGEIDEIKLTKTITPPAADGEESIITLTWDVGNYATALTGYVKYQIVFRSDITEQLGVLNSDTAINGVYDIDSELAEGNNRTWTNNAETSGYKIKWDSTNSRWAIYEANGTTVADYQTFVTSEPGNGTWNNSAVGNTTACMWTSTEAFLYISESIAADQTITAKFPTILRQIWEAVKRLIIRSGVSILEYDIAATDWTEASGIYTLSINDLLPTSYSGCKIQSAQLFKTTANGLKQIDNIEYSISTGGTQTIKSLASIDGKIKLTIKGGNGYFIPNGGASGSVSYEEVQ